MHFLFFFGLGCGCLLLNETAKQVMAEVLGVLIELQGADCLIADYREEA